MSASSCHRSLRNASGIAGVLSRGPLTFLRITQEGSQIGNRFRASYRDISYKHKVPSVKYMGVECSLLPKTYTLREPEHESSEPSSHKLYDTADITAGKLLGV